MATIANLFNRFLDAGAVAEAAEQTVRSEASDYCRLRALPNEDVYFYVKRLDNAKVVREADPQSRAKSLKLLGASCLAAVALIGTLLPSAYGLMAGYQLHNLQADRQKLITERATLELEEARLVSPERLQELAKMQKFIDPTPENVVYLPGKGESLALNRR